MLHDNIGLVWRKIYTSKRCQFEDVTIMHSATASHAVYSSSLPCLHAFYGIYIPPYSTLF